MAKSLIGKLNREVRKRDDADPIVLWVGGRVPNTTRYCYGCGPKHADSAAPVRLSHALAGGVPNGPCDACGELLLRA